MLALVLVFGWWVIRAPAMVRGAVVAPPEIDIDPPGMRARREAALALARAPADPWTFAQSLAPSAPQGVIDRERCGIEDGPQFEQPASQDEPPIQIRAPSPRYTSAQARLDAALRLSAEPLDRAVADLLNIGGLRTPSGSDEAVAQQAAQTSDPRVYALGYGVCHSSVPPAPSCGSISLSGWTRIDPGNGTPWLHLLAQAQSAGDVDGIREAMSLLASATRFETYPLAVAGAVLKRVPEDGADMAAGDDLVTEGLVRGLALAQAPYSPLVQLCKNNASGDEARAQQCLAIGDTLFQHSDSLMALTISGALLFQTKGDASRRDRIHAELASFAAHWSPATGFEPCQYLRDSMKMLRRRVEIGEPAAMREEARRVVTP